MLILTAIIALAVLLIFNNNVRNRRIDRSNRLAEKQEELMQMLKLHKAKEDNPQKTEPGASPS
ncbi:MAG: hypothetical protein JNM14_07110 [Ferruginibacter sp.]|nr:hypothetical protein [Ferruginibacter sp.]